MNIISELIKLVVENGNIDLITLLKYLFKVSRNLGLSPKDSLNIITQVYTILRDKNIPASSKEAFDVIKEFLPITLKEFESLYVDPDYVDVTYVE